MQKMTVVISILIVNHNSFDFVKTSLYSLSKLTKNKYTVYIVDNSDKKNDYEELRRLTHKDKNIFVFRRNSNAKGSYSHAEALDFLTRKIKTKYFSILDADAIWLKKNWDEILIKKLSKKVKVIGSQAPLPKPQDFPLMFACLFETETFKKLHISFKPKSIITHKDTGFEMREKYLRAGLIGQNLIMKNTRFFHHGEFQNVICAEYYLEIGGRKELIASHFGRGSSLGVAKYMSNDRFILSKIPILNFLLAKKQGVLEKRGWINKCYEIINQQSQQTKVVLENAPCDFCHKSNGKMLFRGKDYFVNFPGVYILVECRHCGLIYTNPRLNFKSLNEYYKKNLGYFSPVTPKKKVGIKKIIYKIVLVLYFSYPNQNSIYKSLRIILFPFFAYPYWQMKNFGIPHYVKNGKLLEIGSSYGFYLKQIKDLGWKIKGIEMNKNSVEWGRRNLNLNLINSNFDDYKIKKDDKFDVVVMRMYLEHVYSPKKVLSKVKNMLKKDGRLIIIIPDFNGIEARLYKEYAYTLHLPAHLYHFTEKSIKNYLQRFKFRDIKIYHNNVDRDLIAPLGRIKNMGKITQFVYLVATQNYFRFFLIKSFVTLMAVFGKTSRMTIYCRKNNLM